MIKSVRKHPFIVVEGLDGTGVFPVSCRVYSISVGTFNVFIAKTIRWSLLPKQTLLTLTSFIYSDFLSIQTHLGVIIATLLGTVL